MASLRSCDAGKTYFLSVLQLVMVHLVYVQIDYVVGCTLVSNFQTQQVFKAHMNCLCMEYCVIFTEDLIMLELPGYTSDLHLTMFFQISQNVFELICEDLERRTHTV